MELKHGIIIKKEHKNTYKLWQICGTLKMKKNEQVKISKFLKFYVSNCA